MYSKRWVIGQPQSLPHAPISVHELFYSYGMKAFGILFMKMKDFWRALYYMNLIRGGDLGLNMKLISHFSRNMLDTMEDTMEDTMVNSKLKLKSSFDS